MKSYQAATYRIAEIFLLLLSLTVVIIFITSCASNIKTQQNVISHSATNFSLESPPKTWIKQKNSPEELSQINLDEEYVAMWANKKESLIMIGAKRIQDEDISIPLKNPENYTALARAYWEIGYQTEKIILESLCSNQTIKINDGEWLIPIKKYHMYKTHFTKIVECKTSNSAFPIYYDYVSVWSDTYLYMMQLIAHKDHFDKDKVVFDQVVESLKPLSID